MAATFTTPNRPLTWLITGCSSGMGLALTRAAQSHGHTVIATSRNPSRTPDLVAEVEAKSGRWLALDVDDPHCGDILCKLEDEENTQIDVLVNNAGFSIHQVVESFAEEELRAMMESMFYGPMRLVRVAVPRMRARRFGVVVNVSTGAALEGRESMGGYAAAKAALEGASKVLAKEVAPFNVRVLIPGLGTFNTNMGNAVQVGKMPRHDDYKGSVAEKTIEYMSSGKFVADGDKEKAARAIFDVVVGQGVGRGIEAERYLPLGRDMAARVKQVADGLNHSMEVFGHVCNNVYIDDRRQNSS